MQDGNIISDTYRAEGWEVLPTQKAHAIYIDGIFKGMGFFADEVGCILNVSKEVDVQDMKGNKLTAAFKGIIGKLLDAQLIERGSALKASFSDKIIWFVIGCLVTAVFMMSYGR